MGYEILLYIPNIIGYIRLALLGISWSCFHSNPFLCISLYSLSASLDCIDGYTARKLNQCSAFGAWFDVVIDNVSRGMLWSNIYHFGYLVACVEWMCFVCTHCKGAEWKTSFMNEPGFVKAVMANNYKTPLGILAIAGLHVFPIVLYAHYSDLFFLMNVPRWIELSLIAVLSASRALCLSVEIWCIWSHISYLISHEANSGKGTK